MEEQATEIVAESQKSGAEQQKSAENVAAEEQQESGVQQRSVYVWVTTIIIIICHSMDFAEVHLLILVLAMNPAQLVVEKVQQGRSVKSNLL